LRGGGQGICDSSNKRKNRFPPCQLCGRINHPVFKFYKRFDPAYMGEEKSTNSTHSYSVDSNWYTDPDAKDHVTGGLSRGTCTTEMTRSMRPMAQVCTLKILCIQLVVPFIEIFPYHIFFMLHRISSDNNVFFELRSDFFFIKDQESRKILLQD
jgi:hypothetical protein